MVVERKMNFFTSCFMWLALLTTLQICQASINVKHLDRDAEYRQQNQLPLAEPELEVASIKQHLLSNKKLANMGDKQSLHMMDTVEKSNESSDQQQLRHRRSVASPNQFSGHLINQQLFEDDQTARRKLPDLIMQAHNTDKAAERALLKMLINASLRSALTNVATPQTYYNGHSESWQDGIDGSMLGFETGTLPRMSARLEQAIDNYAGGEPLSNDLSQFLQQDSLTLDKREYIRPCSFNAVSCSKNPFRKL